MTSSNKAPKSFPKVMSPIDPTPQPIPGREEQEAKKKARGRAERGGKPATILASKMMSGRNNILNTRLG